MANWNTPKQNWNVNEVVTAQDMNAIGENLAYLKTEPARAAITVFPTSTNSTANFATLHSTTITTRGGDLLFSFYGSMWHTAGGTAYLDVAIDGTRKALNGTNGSLEYPPDSVARPVSLSLLWRNVSAGTHTVSLQWRTSVQWLHVGCGQFWVLEV